jgi:hypothetical protein
MSSLINAANMATSSAQREVPVMGYFPKRSKSGRKELNVLFD